MKEMEGGRGRGRGSKTKKQPQNAMKLRESRHRVSSQLQKNCVKSYSPALNAFFSKPFFTY